LVRELVKILKDSFIRIIFFRIKIKKLHENC